MVIESGDKGPTILIVMWALTSIALILVLARLYTRLVVLKNPGADDYLVTLSMILGLVFVSITTAAVRSGNGRHAETLTRGEFERAAMLNTIGFAPGILSFVVPKLGVAALLVRILNLSRPHKILLWSLVGGSALAISMCIVIIYAQCDPTRTLWTPSLGNARCWDAWILVDYSIFAGALSACVDVFLAVYPGFVMWKLQMARRKKMGLIVVFSLGACAAVVAAYKCTRLPGLADEQDSTYSTADLVIWTNVESNTIIIAACIPTIIPLIERIFIKKNQPSQEMQIDPLPPQQGIGLVTMVRGNTSRRSSSDLEWTSGSILRMDEITVDVGDIERGGY